MIDERGYLSILGRSKDLVISGGFNVYPKEVEAEIDALPGVLETAVIGLPHPDFGEGVTAVVVLKPGEPRPRTACRAALADRLAKIEAAQARAVRARTCRATPWARCRETCCGRPMMGFIGIRMHF